MLHVVSYACCSQGTIIFACSWLVDGTFGCVACNHLYEKLFLQLEEYFSQPRGGHGKTVDFSEDGWVTLWFNLFSPKSLFNIVERKYWICGPALEAPSASSSSSTKPLSKSARLTTLEHNPKSWRWSSCPQATHGWKILFNHHLPMCQVDLITFFRKHKLLDGG